VALDLEIPWFATASRSARWLVGVSGGADSVALLHLLVDVDFRKLVVCHLDHRLRGRASTGDARFVARLAEGLGLECEIGRVDVRQRMRENSESLETAARNARHEFFAECARKHRCRRVLLAHHADDQAETVLWNLLRGSHGLKGMREEQTIGRLQIIRPLLGLRHAELVGWLETRGLPWREDASNAEAVAVRNRLRNEVFPLLADISGRDPIASFVRGAADFAEHEDLENEALERANLLDPQGRLHLPAMRKLAPARQRNALRRFLVDHKVPSIDRTLLDRAVSMLDTSQPASINLPGGSRLRRREGRLWVDFME
jgi:tRNA(Ile)-lysidine synthase